MEIDNFKRPDHPDFMDSSELRKIHFSGIRHNSISDEMEIWVVGVRKFSMPTMEYKFNTDKWDTEYANIFGLHNVETVKEGN